MTAASHLREFRNRFMWVALAWVAAGVIAYLLSNSVLDFLRWPITEIAQTRSASINYDSITGAFELKLRITLYLSIVLSSPMWLYQAVAFVTPGLHAKEKKYLLGFIATAFPLFILGAVTGAYIFPQMVELLAGFASPEETTLLQASYYFTFVLNIVVTTGIAFVVPVLMVMCNFLGLLPASVLLKNWKFLVLIICLFAALVTPSADLVSMLIISGLLALLFGTAMVIAWFHDHRKTLRGACN